MQQTNRGDDLIFFLNVGNGLYAVSRLAKCKQNNLKLPKILNSYSTRSSVVLSC